MSEPSGWRKRAVVLEAKLAIAILALQAICRSSPCKEGHMSYNTPTQPCDQRIATEALVSIGER